jgi:hypothetical protein
MQETKVISPYYIDKTSAIDAIINNFETSGEPFRNKGRNSLKLFELDGLMINVKSFRVPNFINKIAYRFLRMSKAQRSFEYANKLIDLNIGTPQPIAYYEYKTTFFFNKSYYISVQQDCDLTYRELTKDAHYLDHENILRAFTRFTYNLHENKVNFLDHSPGNTLIKKVNGSYEFYLVDLNRMNFESMSFEKRIKNFAKLSTCKHMITVMSNEYAKCIGQDSKELENLIWHFTQAFQNRRNLKKKLKFLKKK